MSSHTKGKGKGVVTGDDQNCTSIYSILILKATKVKLVAFNKWLNT